MATKPIPMHPLEHALLAEEWGRLGNLLFRCFALEELNSDDRQLGLLVFYSLSRRERQLIEGL